MKKLTYSFLLLMLLTSVPALADYEVPNAVYNAFAASEYSDGMVQGVTLVQFPEKQSVISVVVGMANTQTRYQLLFTLDGGLEDERNATYFNNLLGAEVFLNT